MGHDDRREIFERLEALERLVRSHHDDHGSCAHEWHGARDHRGGCQHHDHHHDHWHDHHDHGEGDFQEKRIIDTIVRLVSEHVGRIVEDLQARAPRQEDGGDEKRFVDLIVKLVSEHVQEIVSVELDRRLGRPPRAEDDERSGPAARRPGPPPEAGQS